MYVHTLCALYYCVVVESTGQRKAEAQLQSKIEGEATLGLAKLEASKSKYLSSDLGFDLHYVV